VITKVSQRIFNEKLIRGSWLFFVERKARERGHYDKRRYKLWHKYVI